MTKSTPLAAAASQPIWRRPVALLVLMAAAMPISFATWSALLNNFVIEAAQFDGHDIGWLHTVREIPGFLSFGVVFVLIFVREQALAVISLCLLGIATAMTAYFPSLGGILTITFLSSVGFHYYETVNQSLQLQWLKKEEAPRILGKLLAVGSFATLISYGLIVLLWDSLGLTYNTVFMIAGAVTTSLALAAWFLFPHYEAPNPQRKHLVLRKRYWLYYLLQFMAGARRQIFVVFAGFMMVERFGFDVHEVTSLFMITLLCNMVTAPMIGRAVGRFGERNVLIFEYTGLVVIFSLYGGIYMFGWGLALAATLYVIDNLFFFLAMALKTYFQKIADPGDIAPTAAVAFTINHIAAVFLPAALGYLWLVSPGGVFVLAAGMAGGSLVLALLIPRHPVPGHETIFARGLPAPADPAPNSPAE
ncbi:MFS transporter [Pseudooceanicola sp. HF7]|uniref:MFS transporter n=1 Tax=Pseudooceanicola sp. HF7 TaxID=2721560 RepID=UPI001430DA19|nr:MFS transporter [Pseudooceanicola sp. HF7]NIZ08938.1 MFS transporter [Pseudooceanicola sp. HF7]